VCVHVCVCVYSSCPYKMMKKKNDKDDKNKIIIIIIMMIMMMIIREMGVPYLRDAHI